MNTPTITIITVSYQSEKEIEKTILSVINQTYPHIEYIIIDGGSTDTTVDIIKKYANHISYWNSEPDKGIYDAMNKGIKKASGNWINFMNCGDTFYDNHVLENIFLNKDKNADIIYGDTNLIYTFGHYLLKGKEISPQNYMPFCHQASFSNTQLMKKYGFDINYKICADKKFFYTAYNNHARFEYVDIVITNYEAEAGISANNLPKATYEMGLIEGKTHKLTWKLKYMLILAYSKMLAFMRRIIPSGFLLYMRKQKVKSFTNCLF